LTQIQPSLVRESIQSVTISKPIVIVYCVRLAFREGAAGQSFSASVDAKSPSSHAKVSHTASVSTLKLEEILHNLAYADRRLQVYKVLL